MGDEGASIDQIAERASEVDGRGLDERVLGEALTRAPEAAVGEEEVAVKRRAVPSRSSTLARTAFKFVRSSTSPGWESLPFSL